MAHTNPHPQHSKSSASSSVMGAHMPPISYGTSNKSTSSGNSFTSPLDQSELTSLTRVQLQAQQASAQENKRRRYRIPRSCDRCRSSKIKCVFENGRCAACAASGLPCTFANPGSLKERPPTQKDVEHLQARIRSLERLIHAVAPSLDLNNLPSLDKLDTIPQLKSLCSDSSSAEHSLDPSDPRALLPPHQSPESSNKSNSAVAPIWSSAHWSQSDNSPSNGRFVGLTFESAHYVGTNGVFSLPDSAATQAGAHVPPASTKSGELSPVDKIIRNQYQQRIFGTQHFYPEPDLEHHLLTLYFTHLHPLYPVLHPPTFLQLHASGLAHTETSFRSLCLFVFALASRLSDDPRVLLDIDGSPHSSPQIAGLRYCFSATSYLYRPIATPATLFDLQGYVLLCMYSLGTVSPMSTWSVAGIGLQRAQEVGAHREQSHIWKSDKLRDHLRRKAFFALNQFDNSLSAILGRTAYMQEEDYDLTPDDPGVDIAIGTLIPPYGAGGPVSREAAELFQQSVMSLINGSAGKRAILPVLNTLHARRNKTEDGNLLNSVKPLVNKIDAGLDEWYSNMPAQLRDSPVAPDYLLASVTLLTHYHHHRQIIHRVLFDCAHDEHSSMSICVSAASSIINLTNQLRQPNLLRHAFLWAPLRVASAAIVLICSIRKERHTISDHDADSRRRDINTALNILNELAPSTYMAETSAKATERLVKLLGLVDDSDTPPGATFDPSQVTNAAFDVSSSNMFPSDFNFNMWQNDLLANSPVDIAASYPSHGTSQE
ncbi:hypothetical protein CROQUDRAFT_662724 [Cronartium quercuum f. sp. fusiforme G11]|uniref:Zn(2)-C6 fungal-type domain-containing protein n=1 Tax=Cronartium quercuum f. sp. fusiforme G11 TaxID=708437 RepID=A0A9P6N9W3_9BASI|nr:hypothetical protein CROQUDRAFT_662724 [Cronartium quercuum f. sp. fusiforme G11]